MKKILQFVCLGMLTASLIIGCSQLGQAQQSKQELKPVVYTSFYPIYNLTTQIAGDTLDVRAFMPTDKDPHLWEPTPKDIRQLSEAELLIVNGANMERWLDQVKHALPSLEILLLADSVELITYKGAAAMGDFQYMIKANLEAGKYRIEFGHTHEDIMRVAFFKNDQSLSLKELIDTGKKIMEQKAPVITQHTTFDVASGQVYGIEMGHESGAVDYVIPEAGEWIFYSDRVSEEILSFELLAANGEDLLEKEVLLSGSTSGLDKVTYDPHSWLSIVNAKKYLNQIQLTFLERWPDHSRTYKKNKLKAVDQLTDLEFEFKEKMKNLTVREFVVTHHAYAYLARDFELRQFPLQGLISTESPSLKTIRKALEFCQYYQIDTVFYEYGAEKKGADTLAAELRGRVMPLASMEYITQQQVNENVSYTSLMRMNLENIFDSLKDKTK